MTNDQLMGDFLASSAPRPRRQFHKSDLALLLVFAFAMGCNLLTYWVSGEQPLRVPKTAFKQGPILLLPFFLWLGWVVFLMLKRGYERPLRVGLRLLRRDPMWLVRAVMILLTISATTPAYSAFKMQIPQIIPFYADPIVIDIESALFGQDAWRLTHSVFGQQATVFLDRLYIIWFPVTAFLVTWATMTRDRVFQARAISTIFFVWFVLGNFLALALSSCGPVYYEHFYGDDRFAPLMDTLRTYHEQVNIRAIVISDWLIAEKDAGKLGAGISALPSIHVAMTFLTWLLVQSRLGWKNPVSITVALYVAAIWIGSVHLAWHYWLDGAVSIVGAALFWKATELWLKPKDIKSVPAPQSVETEPNAAMPESTIHTERVQTG